jgi:DNA ligase-1
MLFKEICEFLEKVEKTGERLLEVKLLSEIFKKCNSNEVKYLCYLLKGRVCPLWVNLEFGIGEKTVIDVISKLSGKSKEEIEKLYKNLGDLGEVAKRVHKPTITLIGTSSLTIEKVYNILKKIAETQGENSQFLKKQYFESLLVDASPIEAKYLVRIVLEKMRVGIGDSTIIESLALAQGKREYKEIIERAYYYCADLGEIAKILWENGIEELKKIKIKPGIPILPALAQRANSAREIIDRMKVCLAEGKYDGFRCQIHKWNNNVKIYSRNLEDLTHMLPEIVESVKNIPHEIIFEGEAISYDETSDQYLPFQEVIQRRRKYDIYEMAKKYPLTLFSFDIMYLDGESLVEKPLKERRKILENIIKPLNNPILRISEAKIINNEKDLEEFFESCVEKGLEGIVAKDLNSIYQAGARGWNWIKLKKSYEGKLSDTVDVVIVGYFYGKGQRKDWKIGAFLCAVYDKDEDNFKTIAKVGSGLTEEQSKWYYNLLKEIELKEKHPKVISNIEPDVWVEPKYVITVMADEITKSPIHTANYALRFPRLIKFREDKNPEDATTLKEIIEMYKSQV